MVGKVSASTQSAKPRLSITLVDAVVESDRVLAKADISKITPVVTRSQVIPSVALAYTIPAANIAYINLFLGIEIDNTGLYKYTGESVVLTDGSVISFTKSPTESVSLADTFFREMNLGKSDSVSLLDTLQALLIFVRTFTETISLSDVIAIATTFNRSFSETAPINDSTAFTFEKYLFDSFALNDLSDVNGTTISFADFTNNVVSSSDLVLLLSGKAIQDSVTSSDSGYLFSQGYCDLTYFAEDYIGDYRTF
jgi:hypothetical protein